MSNIAMTNMNSTTKSSTLDMGGGIVIPPMPHLVAEATHLPSGAIFIRMLRVVHSTLAIIKPC